MSQTKTSLNIESAVLVSYDDIGEFLDYDQSLRGREQLSKAYSYLNGMRDITGLHPQGSLAMLINLHQIAAGVVSEIRVEHLPMKDAAKPVIADELSAEFMKLASDDRTVILSAAEDLLDLTEEFLRFKMKMAS